MPPNLSEAGCPWWSKDLLRDGLRRSESVPALADEWAASENTLYRWINRHGIDREEL